MIAFFDFDGTITTKDSLAEFIKFAAGKSAYYLGLLALSPILTAFVLKLIPNDKAKEKLLSWFFKGYETSSFKKLAKEYSLKEIDKITRAKAMRKTTWI